MRVDTNDCEDECPFASTAECPIQTWRLDVRGDGVASWVVCINDLQRALSVSKSFGVFAGLASLGDLVGYRALSRRVYAGFFGAAAVATWPKTKAVRVCDAHYAAALLREYAEADVNDDDGDASSEQSWSDAGDDADRALGDTTASMDEPRMSAADLSAAVAGRQTERDERMQRLYAQFAPAHGAADIVQAYRQLDALRN